MPTPVTAGEASIAVLALLLVKEVVGHVLASRREGQTEKRDTSSLDGESHYWKDRIERNQPKVDCREIRESCEKLRVEQLNGIVRDLKRIEAKIDTLPQRLNGGLKGEHN